MKKFSVALGLIFAVTIGVHGEGFLKVKPWTYDPADLGVASAAWVNAGGSNHVLYLQKQAPTGANAAAGASVEGVAGLTLNELGFDYRNDGWCGAGAPRFNVYIEGTDAPYFFGCTYGSHTPSPNDPTRWTRVRFDTVDASPAVGTPFGHVIKRIEIVYDEGTDVAPGAPGFAYIDNIDVNGFLIGKPGNVAK
jgi:hypothetical protein